MVLIVFINIHTPGGGINQDQDVASEKKPILSNLYSPVSLCILGIDSNLEVLKIVREGNLVVRDR